MSRTSRALHIYPISLREIHVTQVEDLSPTLRRITFSGEQLLGGQRDGQTLPPLRSIGFDDHVKLVIPHADAPQTIGVQGSPNFHWAPGALAQCRDYTVRRWDPQEQELVIDVVRHESGLASDWAAQAAPGDTVHCAGPKVSAEVNDQVDWHLLAGDETALPAMERWLEEAPQGAKARVLIEVPRADDVRDLSTAADAEITWLVRDPEVQPGWSTLLAEAVADFTPWEGRGFAWVAGEAMTLKPIRRHLRTLMPAEDIEVVGYWRRVEHAAPDGPSPLEIVMGVMKDADIMTPLVLRTALTLGLPAALADGPSTLAELAERTNLNVDRLGPLTTALHALGYVGIHDDVLRLTASGEVLTEDLAGHLSWDHPHAREELALIGLAHTIATGEPSSAARRLWSDAVAANDDDDLDYVIEPLAELPQVRSAETITVRGIGGFAVASALAKAGKNVCLIASPDHDDSRAPLSGPAPGITIITDGAAPMADCTVSIGETATLHPTDLSEFTDRLVTRTRHSLVLVNETADGAASDDHRAGHALIALSQNGTPMLDTQQIESVMAHHGSVSSAPLGWGFAHHVTCLDLAAG